MPPSPAAIVVREAADDDLEAIAACFRASVHGLTATHYDARQRAAWAPAQSDRAAFASRLSHRRTILAQRAGAVVGFLTFEDDGHIDMLYVDPCAARQGVATRLHEVAERHLRALGRTALHTEASLVAEPFFTRCGYEPVERQVVERGGRQFERVAMRKVLAAPAPRRTAVGMAGLLILVAGMLTGTEATAQDVVRLGGDNSIDARVRGTSLVQLARIAIDAKRAEATWRRDVDASRWSSDPAVGVALSTDGEHVGVLFRTESAGPVACAFALGTGERTELGAADSIVCGGGGAEFLLGFRGGFRTVDAKTGAAHEQPALRGFGRVDLAPDGGRALVEDPGWRRVAGPTRIRLDDPDDATELVRGHRITGAAWRPDGSLLAAATAPAASGGPPLGKGTVFLLGAGGAAQRIEAIGDGEAPAGVGFSADARTLYVLTRRELLAVRVETLAIDARRPARLESFAALDPVVGIGFHAQGAELWDLRRLERIRAVALELPAAPTAPEGLRRLRSLGADGRAGILASAVRAPIGRAAVATRAGVIVYELRR